MSTAILVPWALFTSAHGLVRCRQSSPDLGKSPGRWRTCAWTAPSARLPPVHTLNYPSAHPARQPLYHIYLTSVTATTGLIAIRGLNYSILLYFLSQSYAKKTQIERPAQNQRLRRWVTTMNVCGKSVHFFRDEEIHTYHECCSRT